MASLSCPQCAADMVERRAGLTSVLQCPEGHGVFLARADLGALVEAETDWHQASVHDTAQLPRITGAMTEPPRPPARARAWVETLFD